MRREKVKYVILVLTIRMKLNASNMFKWKIAKLEMMEEEKFFPRNNFFF